VAGSAKPASTSGNWGRLIERFVLVTLVLLGATTIVAASWARDMATPRVSLLGADKGISALITAGSARVLILSGTDPAELGNAFERATHPGLDRLDIMIVSGNSAAADIAVRAVELLQPRMVISIGSAASLDTAGIVPDKIVDHTTELELPRGVMLTIEIWPAAGGENDDVTWSVLIERGGASIYWVADREALMQELPLAETDVVVIGRGSPADDTPFPSTRAVAAAAESITGPDIRALVAEAIGPETEAVRVFAGEITRIDLDPEGIRSVHGSTIAATPVP
jgi:hypothetical protein